MSRSQASRGFTLIELMAVLVILSILSSIAVARFVDLRARSNDSYVKSIAMAFSAAVNMAHANWFAKAHPASFELYGRSIAYNATGWPGDLVMTNTRCKVFFDDLLQDAPPSQNSLNSDNLRSFGIFGGQLNGQQVCYFILMAQPSDSSVRAILYVADTGRVSVQIS